MTDLQRCGDRPGLMIPIEGQHVSRVVTAGAISSRPLTQREILPLLQRPVYWPGRSRYIAPFQRHRCVVPHVCHFGCTTWGG